MFFYRLLFLVFSLLLFLHCFCLELNIYQNPPLYLYLWGRVKVRVLPSPNITLWDYTEYVVVVVCHTLYCSDTVCCFCYHLLLLVLPLLIFLECFYSELNIYRKPPLFLWSRGKVCIQYAPQTSLCGTTLGMLYIASFQFKISTIWVFYSFSSFMWICCTWTEGPLEKTFLLPRGSGKVCIHPTLLRPVGFHGVFLLLLVFSSYLLYLVFA